MHGEYKKSVLYLFQFMFSFSNLKIFNYAFFWGGPVCPISIPKTRVKEFFQISEEVESCLFSPSSFSFSESLNAVQLNLFIICHRKFSLVQTTVFYSIFHFPLCPTPHLHPYLGVGYRKNIRSFISSSHFKPSDKDAFHGSAQCCKYIQSHVFKTVFCGTSESP